MVYSRIVKCQISDLPRNQDTRHLRNDVCTIINVYDSADIVQTRWGLLRLTPTSTSVCTICMYIHLYMVLGPPVTACLFKE